MTDDKCVCPDHSRHSSEIFFCQKASEQNVFEHKFFYEELSKKVDRDDVEDMMKEVYADLKTKVNVTFFLLLVSLVIGSLGFQWSMSEQIHKIATDVEVIKTRLKNDNPH